MHKFLLYSAIALFTVIHAQTSAARDVQLRPTFDSDDNTSAPASRPVANTSNMSTEERLQRLERILNSQGLVDMLLRLDNLQNEMQALRGELELHTHQLEEIKQRQRDLYVDIDRRLLSLERNAPAGDAQALVPSQSSQSRATQTSSPGASTAPVTTASTADEQQLYQKAFDLLRELRYEQAVKAFHIFLAKFPQGRYAHIAQYWIGEANYAQRNFKQAIIDYEKLISDHPNSPKLAEAMLKIGYSQYELKSFKQAEKTLNRLIKTYPGTTEASQAKNLIKKIRLKHAG